MSYAESQRQRNYVQLEVTEGTVPNTAGTATVAATDAFMCASFTANASRAVNERPDKTGSYSQLAGTLGKRSATWSMRCTMAGSGSAGTAPDIDAFLQALFGKAPTIVASTSVTYALEDATPSLSIWDFISPSTADQRVIPGAVVTGAKFEFGGDFAYVEINGEAKHVLSKDNFTNEDTTGKSGLTAFPSEPGSQTVSGSAVAGYKGTITLDGNAYTTLRSGSIEWTVAREKDKQAWNSDFPGPSAGGKRTVRIRLVLSDDDSANWLALKNKARNGTSVDLSIVIGSTAGNIWTFSLNDVLFDNPVYDYGDLKRTVEVNGLAAASSISGKNEITLALT